MKLSEQPYMPASPESDFDRRLVTRLYELLSATARKVNAMASGQASGFDGALAAAPTAGTWAPGDFVRNAEPLELGGAGAKYLITGWYCSVGGTPGTWVQARALTGN